MIPAMVPASNLPPASRFSPAKEQAAIRTLRQAHNRALAAHDVEGVIDLATDDFMMILGGGGQLIQGKAAYRDFVATAFADPHPMLFVRTPDRIDVGMPESHPVAAEPGAGWGPRAMAARCASPAAISSIGPRRAANGGSRPKPM